MAKSVIDYIGYKKGRLCVIGEVPKEKRKVKDKRELICECTCGTILNVSKSNLIYGNTNSCGCLALELQHEKALANYIGKRFTRLIGVCEAEDSEPHNLRILCLCDCGNYKSISASDLRTGMVRSCGCLKREKAKERYTEDLTGQTFFELTAIKQVENYVGSTGLERVQWLWRCSCGKEIIAMPMNVKRGMTKSCGHIGKSYAETKIFEFLSFYNVPFEYNVCSFEDLINPETNHKLYLDFVIIRPDNIRIVIEHQGEQHFYNEDCKSDNDFGKLQREITDKIKRQYFQQHEIPFYETRYDEDYIARIKAILIENGFSLSLAS